MKEIKTKAENESDLFNGTLDSHKLYECGDRIAITLSPNMDHQGILYDKHLKGKHIHCISLTDEMARFKRFWDTYFQQLNGWNYDWKMHFEISKGGLFHFHGYATIKDPILFAREWMYIRIFMHNQVVIKTIDDDKNLQQWKEYCMKDSKINGKPLHYINTNKCTNVSDFVKEHMKQ